MLQQYANVSVDAGSSESRLPISIAIPTYRREQTLVDTLVALLALERPAHEILVLDQSETHEAATEQKLADMHRAGAIRWLRLETPSIPKAMNRALVDAAAPTVLFLDDDIIPDQQLVAAHARVHELSSGVIAAGRVLQPWHKDVVFQRGEPFHFACLDSQRISEFMGGNFSLNRSLAISIGGFDENFVKVAYRFESEFAHRWLRGGREIVYEPAALIHHLKVSTGGTRAHGLLLQTMEPSHAVGTYYFTLRTQPLRKSLRVFLLQPLRAVATKHHLRRPWWILPSLIAELRGIAWAIRLYRSGPRYIGRVLELGKP